MISNNKIIFIAGASASGKSTAAARLSKQFDVPMLEVDALFRLLMPAFADKAGLRLAMRELTEHTIEQIITKGSSVVLEGGWLNPTRAHALKLKYPTQFFPVFCGYPMANAQHRYGAIAANQQHWLCRTVDKNPLDWIQQQVFNSEQYARECQQFGLPFVDCSEFESGQAHLEALFKVWLGGAECSVENAHELSNSKQEVGPDTPQAVNSARSISFSKAMAGPLALMSLLFSDTTFLV